MSDIDFLEKNIIRKNFYIYFEMNAHKIYVHG